MMRAFLRYVAPVLACAVVMACTVGPEPDTCADGDCSIDLPSRRKPREAKSSPSAGDGDTTGQAPSGPVSPDLDASVDAPGAPSDTPEASTPGRTVECGAQSCSNPTPDCCASGAARTCVASGNSGCGGIRIKCDERADCQSGYVCCLASSNGVPIQGGCAPPDLCLAAASSVLCKTDADCPGSLSCTAGTPLGYKSCR